MSDPPLVRFLQEFSHFELSPHTDMAAVLQILDEVLAKRLPERAGDRDTPGEVTRLLTELVELRPGMSVCDPVCGTGNLLVACAHHLRTQGEPAARLRLAGQEANLQNWATCKIKLILLGAQSAQIEQGDVLRAPKLLTQGNRLSRFDRVIADIPFTKPDWGWQECAGDPLDRFSYGLPPPSRGDFAFVQHLLATLNQDGKMAVLLPAGALSRKGSEADIRARLLAEDVIEAVISVPDEILRQKGVKAVILLGNRRKDKPRSRQVLMIEPIATRDKQFIESLVNIVRHFNGPAEQVRAVPVEEIRAPTWDLSPSLYIQYGRDERGRELDTLLEGGPMKSVPLGQIAEVQAGCPKRSSASDSHLPQVSYLSVSNVQDGFIDLNSVKTMTVRHPDKYKLQPGDVLFTAGGDHDKLGRSAVWQGELSPCIYQNHLFAVRVDAKYLLPKFLSIYSSSAAGVAYFARNTRGSTGLGHLTLDCLKDFPVPLVSLPWQQQVIAQIWPIIEYSSAVKTSIRRCQAVRTKLRLDSSSPECLRAIDTTVNWDKRIGQQLAQYKAVLLSRLMTRDELAHGTAEA